MEEWRVLVSSDLLHADRAGIIGYGSTSAWRVIFKFDQRTLMAEMFPSSLPDWILTDPKRKAEVRLYNALQEQLPNSYLCFYSFSWVARRPPRAQPSS